MNQKRDRGNQIVMRGHSRLKDGVASARLCPRIHPLVKMDCRVKPGNDELPTH
jgi:hypothetical protein